MLTRASIRLALVAVVVCIVAAGYAVLWSHQVAHVREFRFDDVYITLRYAQNIAHHAKPSFNLDDHVDGFTSPGWTFVLAIAVALGFDGEHAALALSSLSAVLGALAAMGLARRLGAHASTAIGLAGAGPLLSAGYVVWAAPGMETPFAGMVAAATLLAYVWHPTSPRLAALAPRVRSFALVMCALARPECVVLVGVLLAVEAGQMLGVWRASGARTAVRTAAPAITAALVLFVLFALHWTYYGYPLGNTYYFKRGSDILAHRGYETLLDFLRDSSLWIAPVAAFGIAVFRPPAVRNGRAVLGAIALWFVASCIVYARAGGDYLGFDRFYQPLVPVSFAALAVLVGGVSEGDRRWPAWRHAAAWCVAAMAAGYLFVVSDRELELAWRDNHGDIHRSTISTDEWRRVGETLKREYPDTTSLAVRAAGIIPYVTGFRTYDVLGLNNVAVAHSEIRAHYPGHQREATYAQTVAWHPDIIVNHPHVEWTDMTDRPPPDFNPLEFRVVGYRYRCVRMVRGMDWLCLWEKLGTRHR